MKLAKLAILPLRRKKIPGIRGGSIKCSKLQLINTVILLLSCQVFPVYKPSLQNRNHASLKLPLNVFLFCVLGAILSVGYGFVAYKTKKSAQNAIKKLQVFLVPND